MPAGQPADIVRLGIGPAATSVDRRERLVGTSLSVAEPFTSLLAISGAFGQSITAQLQSVLVSFSSFAGASSPDEDLDRETRYRAPLVSGMRSRTRPDLREELRLALERARESADRLEDDEDERPSEQAFRDAAAFIERLPPRTEKPSVWASGDAEVGLTWSLPQGFLEVAFRGDGRLRWAAAFGAEWTGGEPQIDIHRVTRLPDELANYLDRLARAND